MHPNELSDTDPKAAEVQIGIFRRMSPSEKLRSVFALTNFVLRLSEAGVRQQYPSAGEREVFLRAAARRLGRDTVAKVYGWDPEAQDE